MFHTRQILHRSIHILFLVAAIYFTFTHGASAQNQTEALSEMPEILQFTSSGHVLGFSHEGVYVAAGSHVLKESFSGTKGTTPEVNPPAEKDGRAQPFEKVTYPNLWDGVTLAYDNPQGGIIRSTYRIEPGADPDQIALHYNTPVHVSASGNLVFEFNSGTMMASAPIAWQEMDGRKMPVDVAFHFNGSNETVRFNLGNYNPAHTLIIDPTLTWNTFIGGSSSDYGYSITVDNSGNVYVAGESWSDWGSPVNDHTGGYSDAFAVKLNSSGIIQWNTFMGSLSKDIGWAIAVDDSGNVYVIGESEDGWGSPKHAYAGGTDAFVVKLNNSGETIWTTFMGSNSNDYGRAVAVYGGGNVYVVGQSDATWGSPKKDIAGGKDAFVAKLDTSGETVWTTFMGSTANDDGLGVAVDDSENIYVAGYGYSWGNPVNPYAGGTDAFVAKLNNSGETVWHTFMGSAGTEVAYSIAADRKGNIYVTGYGTNTWGNPKNAYAGGNEVYVAKLDSSGGRQWNTFMGSSNHDWGKSIAVDGGGYVYIAGYSYDTWGKPRIPFAGGDEGGVEAFAAKLNNNGSRHWNTFLGSSASDYGQAIAVDDTCGYVYVSGYSNATWGDPVDSYTYGNDAFAAKLIKGALTPWKPLLLLDSSE